MRRLPLHAVALIALVHASACSARDTSPSPRHREPPPIVASRPDAAARTFVGVITAADVVDLASRFDGVVAAVHVRAGDKVEPGQVLVELDPRPMREQVSAAQAALAAAHAARRQADVDVEDAKRRVAVETKAVAEGVSPRVTLEEAQFALKRAVAASQRAASTVAAESSHLQTARDHLRDMSLRAKSSGIVSLRFKDPGATIAAGAPILRIVSQREPRVRFAVPPHEVIALGAEVTATIETIAAPVTAVVRQVSPTLDPASGMIILEAELSSSTLDTELRPGLPVTVAVPTRSR